MRIQMAGTDEEVAACHPVMVQLRPHIAAEGFVARVRLQQQTGYLLAFLEDEGSVRAVAGFRYVENLYSGRVLYVDDLVTDQQNRSSGHGKALFDWLVALARTEACHTLELDSGVQRFDAHRFYLVQRMLITAHHFRLTL